MALGKNSQPARLLQSAHAMWDGKHLQEEEGAASRGPPCFPDMSQCHIEQLIFWALFGSIFSTVASSPSSTNPQHRRRPRLRRQRQRTYGKERTTALHCLKQRARVGGGGCSGGDGARAGDSRASAAPLKGRAAGAAPAACMIKIRRARVRQFRLRLRDLSRDFPATLAGDLPARYRQLNSRYARPEQTLVHAATRAFSPWSVGRADGRSARRRRRKMELPATGVCASRRRVRADCFE